MKSQDLLEIGTLIEDSGKFGVIYRIIESGTLQTAFSIINWRTNYEIYYFDGVITVMGHLTLKKLIDQGDIKIVDEAM